MSQVSKNDVAVEKRMDPELKAKWIAALRSGEYQQHRDGLTNYEGRRNGEPASYCCLGVLCVVGRGKDDMDYRHVNEMGLDEMTVSHLTMRNDGRGGQHPHSFAEIADYIEANL